MPIAGGAFAVQLADTALTTPAGIFYDVRVLDVNHKLLLGGEGSGYDRFQPTGATYSFDSFTPAVAG